MTQSTQGAKRAAHLINSQVIGDHATFGEVVENDMAEIIDRETAAPQLIAALERTLHTIRDAEYYLKTNPRKKWDTEIYTTIRTALAAARGE